MVNIKPGGSFIHDFAFQNNDALDIGKVLLETDYIVVDVEVDNTKIFGEQPQVELLYTQRYQRRTMMNKINLIFI
ncbi:MAG TPA: TasA family protein [Virgibacillus sp.]|nr:TasA family protein [Virgibacillus sp.]HLR68110.1 TasA family protein [Virgibacillus sp.]